MPDTVCAALLSKIHEQLERADHLIALVPEDGLNYAPPIRGAWPTSMLLGHLLDCAAGFCAVLYALDPNGLSHFARLRDLPVNHHCGKEEARERLRAYRDHIDEGFARLEDADLIHRMPTAFVREGELAITLLLGNLEHFMNHKYQLFTYLKLNGIDAGSRDLYEFRGMA